jgi:alkanesulfonate monooxygenase SsuD/methylene tetrahydromethanopterin reductase-like flavin-dependent oxidoreductase (luciferase family)
MRFGLFGGPSRGDDWGSDDQTAYRGYTDSIVEAEQLGFDGLCMVEHHFTGRGQPSAALNILNYLAARTSTIRLGTAVVVVPWHTTVACRTGCHPRCAL